MRHHTGGVQPVWFSRNPCDIIRVLPGPADPKGHRELICISEPNEPNWLSVLDERGHFLGGGSLPLDGLVLSLLHAGTSQATEPRRGAACWNCPTLSK